MNVQAAEDDEAIDSKGIPGWQNVDRLAKALLGLNGLSVTNAQATEIQLLYSELLEYDKKPLTFPPRPIKPSRGRFARTKQYRVGNMGIEAVKRYCVYFSYTIALYQFLPRSFSLLYNM